MRRYNEDEGMNQDPNFWTQWLPASLELHTLQWATLLAAAALLGYVLQRHWHIPKVVGYALVGSGAGLLGLGHTLWPVQGGILLLLQLTMSVVLFECGGRITLRWFRHNPMVLVQSLLEAGLTYGAVFWSLRALGLEPTTACALGLIAMAASPVVLARVVQDMRASGHVTDRALVLATLSTLYALMLGCVQVQWLAQDAVAPWWQGIWPAAQVLLSSAAVALVLCAVMRLALSWMSPLSESTSLLLLCLIAAGTAIAELIGGWAPLTALLAGMLLKQWQLRPWTWPRQLGTASSLLSLLMFVLVSAIAAQVAWTASVAAAVVVLIVVRLLAKAVGVGLGNMGSGASWRQAVWVAGAMMPMSAVALLLTLKFIAAAPDAAQALIATAMPAIWVLELAGAIAVALSLRRAGETEAPARVPVAQSPRSGD